jgi:hypothetical protein
MRWSLLPSASLVLVLGILPCRNPGCSRSDLSLGTLARGTAGELAGTTRTVGLTIDRLRVMSIGGVPSRISSYGTPMTGTEFERLLTCFRPPWRRDFVRVSRGICTCIFFARLRNDLAWWLCDVDGCPASGSGAIGVACCLPAVSSTLATVAIRQ